MSIFVSASLFPSPATPYTGLFVWHRLKALCQEMPHHNFFVVSPTPYFPINHPIFKHYAIYAQKPNHIIDYQGFRVAYPRYFQLPLTDSKYSGYFTYLSTLRYFKKFVRDNNGYPKFLIAEYGFPDAISVYHLSKKYNIPYCVTLRGSDISYFMKIRAVYPQMIEALNHASAVICVSNDMAQELKDNVGFKHPNLHILSNGVECDIFHIQTNDIRNQYHITTKHLISTVGGLITRKNHVLAIDALKSMPDTSLIIVGKGEQEQSLKNLVRQHALEKRVIFAGGLPQAEIAKIYSASDLFLLTSLSEGRPNVVLEALASGCPVLSSNIQGINELITNPTYGEIFKLGIDAQSLSQHISNMLTHQFNRPEIQKHGHSFSWKKCAKEYKGIIDEIINY